MSLSLISFVGIDNYTDLTKLLDFNPVKYEFGVLYSPSCAGKDKRYPDFDFCKNYLKWTNDQGIKNSLHLCGSAIDLYLDQDPKILQLCSLSNRIQLNIKLSKYNDHDELSDKIIDIAENRNHYIILQQNRTKKEFNDLFMKKISNDFSLSLLNDSSGGLGREIKEIDPPHAKHSTGYAGGINPDNILSIKNRIDKINNHNYFYYLDMESGIRDNNEFSIQKCSKIRDLMIVW